MYIDYSAWETFEYSLNTLQLDLKNPRIRYRGTNLNQTQIMKFMVENEKVYELAKKISEEGYFVGEEPIICIEDNKKIVLEGNRRAAALKLLKQPKKYLTPQKANILLRNIATNNFPVDKKLRCYIAPNRLLANPIIYERHNGATLERWKTGNQYAFVAEMYYEDGLSIKDICEVLNVKRNNVIKPLKAYNLFYEAKDILEQKDGVSLDIGKFEFTNLERFYDYEPARKFIGIEFDAETAELWIKLPSAEFEKRLSFVFKELINADGFSRKFNNDKDKKEYLENLKKNTFFDLTVSENEGEKKGKTSGQKKNLDEEKDKTNPRRKRKRKKNYHDKIIPSDKEIIFDNDKLDGLFAELKQLPIDKKYSFALLLRSYLEQTLYFYIQKKNLFDDLDSKANEEKQKNSQKKIDNLVNYLNGKHNTAIDDAGKSEMMSILKFNQNKDYSNASLKLMLDYVKKHELEDYLDAQQLKNMKHYIDRIKDGLDLAVHNIETVIDVDHNKRAWQHLVPLFDILSDKLQAS